MVCIRDKIIITCKLIDFTTVICSLHNGGCTLLMIAIEFVFLDVIMIYNIVHVSIRLITKIQAD